jgi:hypothetical protein
VVLVFLCNPDLRSHPERSPDIPVPLRGRQSTKASGDQGLCRVSSAFFQDSERENSITPRGRRQERSATARFETVFMARNVDLGVVCQSTGERRGRCGIRYRVYHNPRVAVTKRLGAPSLPGQTRRERFRRAARVMVSLPTRKGSLRSAGLQPDPTEDRHSFACGRKSRRQPRGR